MKKSMILIFLLACSMRLFAQVDTNYTTRVVSVEWMPDGKDLLINVIKFHKTNRQAPFISKVYRYNLLSKQAAVMFENGSNLAPSPDGRMIAFMKRDENPKRNIFLYNLETKQETLLKTDTSRKGSLTWSPDGKNLMYNITYNGINQFATIDICVLELATNQITQVTHSGSFKSYTPVWGPDSKKIVYYLEKGDNHDQVWLTDINGSFHTNLTNDTSTHNFYPSWIDEKTIIYTQSPDQIMIMNTDGTDRRKVEGLNSFLVKFNAATGMLAYLTMQPGNKLVLYDWKKKTNTILLDENALAGLTW